MGLYVYMERQGVWEIGGNRFKIVADTREEAEYFYWDEAWILLLWFSGLVFSIILLQYFIIISIRINRRIFILGFY